MNLVILLVILSITNLAWANNGVITPCIASNLAKEIIDHLHTVNYVLIAILVFGSVTLAFFLFMSFLPQISGFFGVAKPSNTSSSAAKPSKTSVGASKPSRN